jgi:hypothetical protein
MLLTWEIDSWMRAFWHRGDACHATGAAQERGTALTISREPQAAWWWWLPHIRLVSCVLSLPPFPTRRLSVVALQLIMLSSKHIKLE